MAEYKNNQYVFTGNINYDEINNLVRELGDRVKFAPATYPTGSNIGKPIERPTNLAGKFLLDHPKGVVGLNATGGIRITLDDVLSQLPIR